MRKKSLVFGAALSIACAGVGAVNASGYVEQYNLNYISGWACDRDDPNHQVGVHIWREDGHYLAGTGAVLPRESAVGAACGSTHSNHGFEVRYTVPPNLMDNKWYKVEVWIIPSGGSPMQITNSPVRMHFGTSAPTDPPIPPGDPYADVPNPRPMISIYLGPVPAKPNYSWGYCNPSC